MKNIGKNDNLDNDYPNLYNPRKTESSERGLCMIGRIYTGEKCTICQGKLIHDENKNGFVCKRDPKHPFVVPKNCRVKFGRYVSRRFSDYRYLEARQFLQGLRYKTIEGTFDA